MALKTKPATFLERQLNDRSVQKHRKNVLKINYFKGLNIEYRKKPEKFIGEEKALIDGYFQSDVQVYRDALNGKTAAYFKVQKQIENIKNRAYWQRRKYKTTITRKKLDHIDELLKDFDKNQKIEINQKIDRVQQSLKGQEKHQEHEVLKQKIAALENKYQQDLEKMQNKAKRLKVKLDKRIAKNEKHILSLTQTNVKIMGRIEAYNKKREKDDQDILNALLEKKANIKNNQISEKKLANLDHTIDNIQTIKNVLSHDDIHLSISHLKMYFGGVKAINDLSFDVKRGEIFGLIGPNGAGKTTVFNCITQFYKATGGQMILRNKDNHVIDLYHYKTHDMIKEGIARSFQNVELIWELTVLDNLMVSAHSLLITSFADHMLHTPKLLREDQVIRAKGYRILKDLGIESYAFRSPYGLPYGVLKKIELARTLMTDPSLIILDEPAAGLNDAETEDLAKVIKKINTDYNVTIFLVEHDMGLVMSICNRICAISFGKRIGLGTPKDIQNNPEVRKAYLGDDSDE